MAHIGFGVGFRAYRFRIWSLGFGLYSVGLILASRNFVSW